MQPQQGHPRRGGSGLPPPASPFLNLTPIREATSQEESDDYYSSYQEAMEPLTFLPDVDAVPLTPSGRQASRKPLSSLQHSLSAEDFAILSGASSWPNLLREDSSQSSVSGVDATDSSWSGLLGRAVSSLVGAAFSALVDTGDAQERFGSEGEAEGEVNEEFGEEGLKFGVELAINPAPDSSLWI